MSSVQFKNASAFFCYSRLFSNFHIIVIKDAALFY